VLSCWNPALTRSQIAGSRGVGGGARLSAESPALFCAALGSNMALIHMRFRMRTLIYSLKGVGIGLVEMNWAQALADNPLVVLSIMCASAAVVVLFYDFLKSRRRSPSHAIPRSSEPNSGSRGKKSGRSLFDRITLLNRNFVQCQRCFRIELVNVQFCSGCGAKITTSNELW